MIQFGILESSDFLDINKFFLCETEILPLHVACFLLLWIIGKSSLQEILEQVRYMLTSCLQLSVTKLRDLKG